MRRKRTLDRYLDGGSASQIGTYPCDDCKRTDGLISFAEDAGVGSERSDPNAQL